MSISFVESKLLIDILYAVTLLAIWVVNICLNSLTSCIFNCKLTGTWDELTQWGYLAILMNFLLVFCWNLWSYPIPKVHVKGTLNRFLSCWRCRCSSRAQVSGLLAHCNTFLLAFVITTVTVCHLHKICGYMYSVITSNLKSKLVPELLLLKFFFRSFVFPYTVFDKRSTCALQLHQLVVTSGPKPW